MNPIIGNIIINLVYCLGLLMALPTSQLIIRFIGMLDNALYIFWIYHFVDASQDISVISWASVYLTTQTLRFLYELRKIIRQPKIGNTDNELDIEQPNISNNV
jgi:hypothetical protein